MNGSDSINLAQRRFRAIVPPLLDDAYTLAKWLCRNGADAEDVVQEAAIRALKALETTAVERPKPWFLMIVRNTAMTWMAKNRPKTLAYAGDLADLDVIGSPLGDDRPPDPEETLIALEETSHGRARGRQADRTPGQAGRLPKARSAGVYDRCKAVYEGL